MNNTAEWPQEPTWRDPEDSVVTEVFRTKRRRARNLILGGAVGAAYIAVVALTVLITRAVAAVLP